jgi:hypothetical protein
VNSTYMHIQGLLPIIISYTRRTHGHHNEHNSRNHYVAIVQPRPVAPSLHSPLHVEIRLLERDRRAIRLGQKDSLDVDEVADPSTSRDRSERMGFAPSKYRTEVWTRPPLRINPLWALTECVERGISPAIGALGSNM